LKRGFIGIYAFFFVIAVVALILFGLSLIDSIWVQIVHLIDRLFGINNIWIILAINVAPILALYLYYLIKHNKK
jgi:uncharacterized BrkB/YihY/UPF0761 family membrane protein